MRYLITVRRAGNLVETVAPHFYECDNWDAAAKVIDVVELADLWVMDRSPPAGYGEIVAVIHSVRPHCLTTETDKRI